MAVTTVGRAVTRRMGVAALGLAALGLAALALTSFIASPMSAAGAATTPPVAHAVITNVGPGYSVTTQGPLGSGQIASSAPDPTAAASALTQLSHAGAISTYERVWEDAGQNNAVQDLVVRFSTVKGARIFDTSVVQALTSGEVVHSGPLSAIPGSFRTTYFAVTNKVGVGQAIAMRSGHYVAVLSFFSSNSASNAAPITPNDAVRIAEAQHALISTPSVAHPAARKKSPGTSPFLVVGLIVVIALIFFAVARRWFVRSLSSSTAAPSTEPIHDPAASASASTSGADASPPAESTELAPSPLPAAPAPSNAGRSAAEQAGIWSQTD